MDEITKKYFRKFKQPECYNISARNYYLLPFRFIRISEKREVLVNEVGDFLIVPIGTAERLVNREIRPEESIYSDLFSNYFISEKPIPPLIDLLATRYRTKKSFLENFTSLHIFVLTLRCNHSCHYCQVSRVTSNRRDYDISYENLDFAILHMFRSPNPTITMEFQGGEPLLAYDKLKYAVEKTNEINKKFKKDISFVLCTNSTIFTDEILHFCKLNKILISTSLDGPEHIHNANRPKSGAKSYNMVVEGINKARSVLGENRVSALMTTSTLSLDHPIEIIDNYVENGFDNIFLRPISPYGFAIKNKSKNIYHSDEYLNFYKTGLDYIIKLNRNGHFFVEDYTAIILKKILTPFPVNYVDLQSPAGIINNVIVFNYNGNVYVSDEARMLAENNDHTFQLGTVGDSYESIFYGSKARHLAQFWNNESLAGCSDCAFQGYCGADPVYNYATQGDFEGYRPTSGFCKKNMEIIKYLFMLIDENDSELISIFRSWIKNN